MYGYIRKEDIEYLTYCDQLDNVEELEERASRLYDTVEQDERISIETADMLLDIIDDLTCNPVNWDTDYDHREIEIDQYREDIEEVEALYKSYL